MQSGMFKIERACTELIFKWCNFRPENGSPSRLLAGEYPYTVKAAIVYNNINYPIGFASGRTASVPPDGLIASLPLSLSLPAGTEIELRWLIEFETAPAQWPASTRYNMRWNYFGVNANDDVDGTGRAYNAETRFMVLPPYQIVGNASGHKKAVEIMGDSISSDGSDDGFLDDSGYTQRGLVTAGIPFTNNGASGNSLIFQLESWASTPEMKARRLKAHADKAVSHVICGLCINDFASGATDASILGHLSQLKTILDQDGIKLIPITCYPWTNGANNAAPNPNVWARRRNLNNTLRANNGVGYGLLDIASVCQDPNNIDLWRTDLGTPTTDGVHPRGIIHDVLAAYVAQQMPVIMGVWS